MNKTNIYADHAATTPISSKAREAMEPFLGAAYGNPSTLYNLAREPRKAVANAREIIAAAIHADPSEIYFTSGGTEADNWAIKGIAFQHTPSKKIITSAIEHHAVLNTCSSLRRMGYRIHSLPVDSNGIVREKTLEAALSPDTILVSVMLANNEIGTIEPVQKLAEITHKADVLFHTDAVQAIGHIPVEVDILGVDLLSASAHKFNGPKGIGFLYIRKGTEIIPLMDGGGQENGMRSGTENVASIVGMTVALQEHIDQLAHEASHLQGLADILIAQLKKHQLDFRMNGSSHRIPGNLSLSFKDTDGEMLLHRLDLMGTAVATGSACNSKETELSHVIEAIQVPESYANGTIRITLGMDNTEEQMYEIANQIYKIISA